MPNLETILNSDFIIQDNWPLESPDITYEFKNWVSQTILKYKIQLNNLDEELLTSTIGSISIDNLDIDEKLKSILQIRLD